MTTDTASVSAEPAVTLEPVQSLIGSTWVDGAGPTKDIRNPATGEVVSTVAFSTPAQIDEAVASAKRAQREWAKIPLATRVRILHAGVDAIETNGDEVAVWISREMGKTLSEAREEVFTDATVPLARAALEDARRFGGRTPTTWSEAYPDRRVQTLHQPIGVTGFISPWNFPTEMLFMCIASMAMGNSAVWKPSEWAPTAPVLATRIFLKAATAAGLPDGLLNVIWGGPEEGEHLVAHESVGLIGFIGSTAVGEQIHRAAGVKKLLLELGGNGPLIVLDDADIDRAVAATVYDCFYQAGQVCTSGERVLVHEAIHDEFVGKVVAAARDITLGDPFEESTDMGPLSDQRILDKVVAHVEDARTAGATIETGGSHDGLFYEPTVLTGVTTDMRIAREETFGPVIPIIRVASAEEALEIANDSEYGLSMAVFTSSLRSAYVMGEGLQAGAVNVNEGTNSWEHSSPFGGWKKSGIGRELGEATLREFTNEKTLSISFG
jgi:succinate-semialdehyde dehydrogenase/glutarate-semialdehyde dehydrogenase